MDAARLRTPSDSEARRVFRGNRVCAPYAVSSGHPRTCPGTLHREHRPTERIFPASQSIVNGPAPDRRLEPHSERADDATRVHSTLSAETKHVQVFYPFHPLHGSTLRVDRRPKQGDGAVSVSDPAGRRLKIPLWMLLPNSAEMKIAQQPLLSKEALLSLTSLLVTLPNIEDRVHDNLLQTVVDGCKGGHRAATTTSGHGDSKGRRRRADRHNGTNRTDRSHGPHSGGGLSSGRRETS